MKLHARVLRPRKAAAAENPRLQLNAVVAAVFLRQQVSRAFACAEKGMRAAVDREVLGNAMLELRIRVIVPSVQFRERHVIWPVPVNLVRADVNEQQRRAV